MRRAWMGILVASLGLFASAVGYAETYEYPEGDALFTIDFPDGWKVECDGANMHAMPADESMYLGVLPVEADSLDAATEALDEAIASVVDLDEVGEAETMEINGISFVIVEGTGKDVDDGTPLSVATAIFAAGDSFIIMPYFGDPATEAAHENDLASILGSIKIME